MPLHAQRVPPTLAFVSAADSEPPPCALSLPLMKLPLSVLRPLPRPLKPPPPLPPPPLPPPLPPPAASSWMSCACRDVMRRLPPSPLWPLKDGPPRLPPPRCMALPLCCCFALLRLVLVRLTRRVSRVTSRPHGR